MFKVFELILPALSLGTDFQDFNKLEISEQLYTLIFIKIFYFLAKIFEASEFPRERLK